MPPIKSSKIEGGSRYSMPFLGSIEQRLSEKVDVSELSSSQVDSDGYLIPGVPLKRDSSSGLLEPIDGADQTARGCVLEAVKVAESNSDTDLDAADDIDVVVVVAGTLDRAIAEYDLDRSLTDNEITALGNSHIVVTDPET